MPLVDILFALSKVILIIFEKHATHYQTLETWIGHDATRYPILNVLPHALPHALPYIFLWGFPGFGQFEMGYHMLLSNL